MPTYTVRQTEVNPYEDEEFDVGEDEVILNSQFRSSTRLLIAIMTPVNRTHMCDHPLSDGARCGREVTHADERCWQHEGES